MARVNVAVSNGYDSENSKSLTMSCSTLKNEGPPKIVNVVSLLMGTSHLAWMCTAVSLRSPSNSPVTAPGWVKKKGGGTCASIAGVVDAENRVNPAPSARLFHTR